MQFQKGNNANPKGNPNIREISKKSTGPRTDEGKLRGVLASGLLKHGQHSKLLKKVRKCKVCPLGQRTHIITVNGKTVEKTMPAKCAYYMAPETKNGTKCILPVTDFIRDATIYYRIGREIDTMALQEAVTQQAIRDAMVNRDVDMIEKGKPGFYTKEFTKLALDSLEGMNKIKFGGVNQHSHVHVGENMARMMLDQKDGDEKDDKKKSTE